MTDTDITSAKSVLLAIDITKNRHGFLIKKPDWKRLRHHAVLNTQQNFGRLAALPRDHDARIQYF